MSNPIDWIGRLSRWRSVYATWQLGARDSDDAEGEAVADQRELTLNLRAEVNALSLLLVAKGVFTREEFFDELQRCSHELCRQNERRFPGFRTSDNGVEIHDSLARDTMASWVRERI